MRVELACIVEGHGEVQALPILIRRIAERVAPDLYTHVHPPIRIPANKLILEGELERALRLACIRLEPRGGVFVLLDSEDDLPCEVAPSLQTRAEACMQLPVSIVLAYREYETWFLAGATSLRGLRGLPADLAPPENPEQPRGAKEWLSQHMLGSRRYLETSDQAALTAALDLDLARSNASFDKCYRELSRLLREVAELA
jgi:hypothetical protein